MTIKIGINGFGRMGRLCARHLINQEGVELVHVNEKNSDAEGCAYLLQFDSIHGRYANKVDTKDDKIVVQRGDRSPAVITHTQLGEPGLVPWESYGVDLVVECSGKFNDVKKLQAYFEHGVKRVVVSAPVVDAVNAVVGCNDDLITPDVKIVTAASCTTNCIAPVIKVMDQAFGIERGMINTIHNITQTQSVMDAPNTKKSDPRRARSGMLNLAPTSTGSAKAVTMIFPHLKGKIDGVAIRVPLQNSSITDLTLVLNKDVTVDEVNQALRSAADDVILGFEERPLVSTDFINDARSSIVDAQSTMVVDKRLVKLLCWYDNEFGYATRLFDITMIVAKQMSS